MLQRLIRLREAANSVPRDYHVAPGDVGKSSPTKPAVRIGADIVKPSRAAESLTLIGPINL
jgi:hypothetical protein